MNKIRRSDFCPKCGTYFESPAVFIHFSPAWIELDGTKTSEDTLHIQCRCGYETTRAPMDAKETT